MEKGWKTIKMADAFELQMGKTPSRNNPDYWDGTETWVSIGDMGVSKYIGTSKEQISKKAVSDTGIKLLPQETVIMSFKLSVGKVAITSKPLFTNEAIMSFTPKKGFSFLADYIYYYLKGYKWDGTNRAVMGITLNKASISQGVFSYPSLSEQKRIVAELDLLTDVIDKQKQQLKELDTLAQSIFYDMFGDPVENDRGWKTDALSNVAPQKQYDGVVPSYRGHYWLLNLDMVEQQTGRVIERILLPSSEIGSSITTFDTSNVLYSKLRPYLNKVVIPDAIGYATSELVPLKPNPKVLGRVFLAYLLRSKSFVDYISVKVAGAKMPRVSMDVLRAFAVILPSIALQQSFAMKIEAIEKQKENINQSIAQTQKLFDYTMDKYFG